jgi:SAM-dependent methyltransferase
VASRDDERSPSYLRDRQGQETGHADGLRCYLCGSRDVLLVQANRSYSYVSCRACGFRRRHPLPSAQEERELYEADYYEDRGLVVGLEGQSSLLLELIRSRVAKLTALNGGPGSLLDVGAGTGLFMEAAIQAGWTATGLETSEAAARIAGRITRGRILQGRIEDLDFQERFDAATVWDVLEHLPDPRASLSVIRMRLKARGLVGISLPNVSGLKARLRGNRWRYYQHSFGHISHFSPRTLSTLLEQAGFRPEAVSATGVFNLGRLFGLDAVAVHRDHGALRWAQAGADGVVGLVGMGESIVAFARAT